MQLNLQTFRGYDPTVTFSEDRAIRRVLYRIFSGWDDAAFPAILAIMTAQAINL